ncbi:uncharacterized protein LOC132902891 isoform X2 [Amyelois transitella]|uniref:uncharacterized protein LOC132902891 isoform X2 n=1 Tax=Amyelois transitella TaxID=680683 RepID=UPI0029901ACA|nr:uncharacterized protein LOC132902891 isoform X2 [Amyelois transitella]
MEQTRETSDEPLSEVGSRGLNTEETATAGPSSNTGSEASSFLTSMEALLSRLLTATQNSSPRHTTPQLIKFDPDEADSDIEGDPHQDE